MNFGFHPININSNTGEFSSEFKKPERPVARPVATGARIRESKYSDDDDDRDLRDRSKPSGDQDRSSRDKSYSRSTNNRRK